MVRVAMTSSLCLGNDNLKGGSGDDELIGGAGADKLDGGAGKDYLTGDAGSDMFIFRDALHTPNSAAADFISDFNEGVDLINLRRIDADTTPLPTTTSISSAWPHSAVPAKSGMNSPGIAPSSTATPTPISMQNSASCCAATMR